MRVNRSTYEVIDFVASLVEELLTSFNNFVTKMKVMAGRGTDKRLGDWLYRSYLFAFLSKNHDVCRY
jgi:hypothetical protein